MRNLIKFIKLSTIVLNYIHLLFFVVRYLMNSIKVEPKYNSNINPRIGLIALASDFIIEKDFLRIIKDKDIDFFVNRIEIYNPLTSENLIRMSQKITDVTKDILPNQKIDCVVYGCSYWHHKRGYILINA